MTERDACLTVSASTVLELLNGMVDPDPAQQRYALHCRVVFDGALVTLVDIYEIADRSGHFRPIPVGPALRSLPRFKILRDEPWPRRNG